MSAGYSSFTDGLVLVSTIVFWNYVLDWLSFRFVLIRKLTERAPLPLVRDGRMLRRNMPRELISEDELMKHIRQSGADSLEGVNAAYMESDGRISVIKRE